MARERRCTWCGAPRPVGGHDCEPPTAPLPIGRGDGPLPRSTSDLGPVDTTPRGTGHVGSQARNIVVTPLGMSHVSPAVLARLGYPAPKGG